MDLVEYQAKKLFRQVDIPTLPFQTIYNPRELKQLKIPYPVVLKSQVKVGGRGKAGGIRFVANTIDAIAAARNIFNLPILGEYPKLVLAEIEYDVEAEFFLAVVLDYQLQRPVLLGSASGGVNVKPLLNNLKQVVVDREFSPFYARRLTVKMGLTGDLVQSVSGIVAKMYRLFQTKDLDLIEINPLGINSQGELMALDGKITANDLALSRHLDVMALQKSEDNIISSKRIEETSIDFSPTIKTAKWLDWENKKGNTAVICNSEDLAILTWDLLCQKKGKPACCVLIDERQYGEQVDPASLQQQLSQVLGEINRLSNIKVILVNILATAKINEVVAQTISQYYQPQAETNGTNNHLENNLVPSEVSANFQQGQIPGIKIIMRSLTEINESYVQDIPKNLLDWTDNLEKAVEKAISCGESS